MDIKGEEMKYILIALLLAGCGGSSTPETIIETEVVEVPTIERECAEPETIYVVEYVDRNVTVEVPSECNCTVVEEEIIFYLISTTTRDGDYIQERVYSEDGLILSDYNELENTWYKWAYDENNNQTSFTIERDGIVLSYTYSTYDENSNLLTDMSDSGRHAIHTYDEDNHRIRTEIDYNGDGVYNIEVFTYENGLMVKKDYQTINKYWLYGYDENNNLASSEIFENNVSIQIETYTWQEFTL